MQAFASRWDITLLFRAAHEPGGNGIVERQHRTVKVMVARQKCTVPEAVHRYNFTPKDDQQAATAPAQELFRHTGRDLVFSSHDTISPETGPRDGRQRGYEVGDPVWFRKRGDQCSQVSSRGVVTRLISPQTLEVNGVPWHIRNVRHRLEENALLPPTSRVSAPYYYGGPPVTVNDDAPDNANVICEPAPGDEEAASGSDATLPQSGPVESDVGETEAKRGIESAASDDLTCEGDAETAETVAAPEQPEGRRHSVRERRPLSRYGYEEFV